MSDTVLENAAKKRDALAAEINSLAQRIDDLKRELSKIDEWIALWHDFAAARPRPLPIKEEIAERGGIQLSESPGSPKKRRATGNPRKEDVADAAREVIKERGEPVSRTSLFKALSERGVTISSENDPEVVLSTMLWRTRDRVTRLKTGGYWLPERPWIPAGYDPDSQPESPAG